MGASHQNTATFPVVLLEGGSRSGCPQREPQTSRLRLLARPSPLQNSPLVFFMFTCFHPGKLSYSSFVMSKAFWRKEEKSQLRGRIRRSVPNREDAEAPGSLGLRMLTSRVSLTSVTRLYEGRVNRQEVSLEVWSGAFMPPPPHGASVVAARTNE